MAFVRRECATNGIFFQLENSVDISRDSPCWFIVTSSVYVRIGKRTVGKYLLLSTRPDCFFSLHVFLVKINTKKKEKSFVKRFLMKKGGKFSFGCVLTCKAGQQLTDISRKYRSMSFVDVKSDWKLRKFYLRAEYI